MSVVFESGNVGDPAPANPDPFAMFQCGDGNANSR